MADARIDIQTLADGRVAVLAHCGRSEMASTLVLDVFNNVGYLAALAAIVSHHYARFHHHNSCPLSTLEVVRA